MDPDEAAALIQSRHRLRLANRRTSIPLQPNSGLGKPAPAAMEGASLVLGARVRVRSRYEGTVRYLGPIHYGKNRDGRMFVGVELDIPKGKNDGTIKGLSYFQCPVLHCSCAVFEQHWRLANTQSSHIPPPPSATDPHCHCHATMPAHAQPNHGLMVASKDVSVVSNEPPEPTAAAATAAADAAAARTDVSAREPPPSGAVLRGNGLFHFNGTGGNNADHQDDRGGSVGHRDDLASKARASRLRAEQQTQEVRRTVNANACKISSGHKLRVADFCVTNCVRLRVLVLGVGFLRWLPDAPFRQHFVSRFGSR